MGTMNNQGGDIDNKSVGEEIMIRDQEDQQATPQMLIENQTDTLHQGPQAHFESKIIEVNESEEDKSSKQAPKLLIQDENSQYISGNSLNKSGDFEGKVLNVEDQIQALIDNNRAEMAVFANSGVNFGRNVNYGTADTALEQTIAPPRTAIHSARSVHSMDQDLSSKATNQNMETIVADRPQ